MANPLKMLKLKPTGFQFIQEVPIEAPPQKVWDTVVSLGKWCVFSDPTQKQMLELWPGGRWHWEGKEGTGLFGIVSQVEPGKLLRITGALGMNHMPATSALIFELQPKKDGRATLLRLGQRTFGYLTADVKKNYGKGWKQLMAQLKAAAEK